MAPSQDQLLGLDEEFNLANSPPTELEVHAGSGQTIAVDSREKAPAGALREMFVGVPNASLQGVAVGVPGMVRGTALSSSIQNNNSSTSLATRVSTAPP